MTEVEPGSKLGRRPPFLRRAAAFVRDLYREELAAWRVHYRRYFKTAARVLGLGFVAGFVFFLLRPDQEKRAFAFLLRSLGDIPLGAPPLVLALTLFYHNTRASLLAVAAGGFPFLCLPIVDPFVNGAALGLLASISKHQGLNVPLLFLKSVAPHGLFELPAVLYATSAGLYLSVSLGREARAAVRRRRARAAEGPAVAAAPDASGEAVANSRGGDTGPAGAGTASVGQEACSMGPGSGERTGEEEIGDMDLRPMPLLMRSLVRVARSFVLVVLPLLLVAAFVEAFITPLLR